MSAPQTVRFLVSAKAVPADATVSLISNGQVVRSFSVKPDNQPEVIELKCERDSYFRLEIRNQSKGVLALTNPIYVRLK